MNSGKLAFHQTLLVALGQVICSVIMVGTLALLGKMDFSILLGGLAGAALACVNFFFLALFAQMAADKAAHQDVTGGQKLLRLSYLGRMTAVLAVLVFCAKTDVFYFPALVMPLAFTRPILTVAELMKKKGAEPS